MLTVPTTLCVALAWSAWAMIGALAIGLDGSMVIRRRNANPNSFMTLLLAGCPVQQCMMGPSPNLQSFTDIRGMAGQNQVPAWHTQPICFKPSQLQPSADETVMQR